MVHHRVILPAADLAGRVPFKRNLLHHGPLSIPEEEAIRERLAVPTRYFDHLGGLHHADEPRRNPDDREYFLRRGMGKHAPEACGLSGKNRGRLAVESPDCTVEEDPI